MSTFAPQDLAYCRRLVHEVAGLLLDERKDYLFEARLRAVLQEFEFDSMAKLVEALQTPASRQLRDRVVDAMTTNETSFFRDDHPFEAMRQFVVPALLDESSRRRELVVWSAACSTGQEPVSLAMLLHDALRAYPGRRFKILATDLSPRVLAQARAGTYTDVEVRRGMPEPLRERYLTRDGKHWRIKDELRSCIEFREFNLTGSWASIPRVDVVFLRNVLIYFDVATKHRILGEVRRLLPEDGVLCLGAAETVLGIRDDYVPLRLGRATFYRPTPGVGGAR